MKKKFIALFMGSLLLVGSAVTGVSAAGYKGYTDYILYAGYENNYTSFNKKTTSDQYINNKVTSLYKTSSATFWANDQDNSGAYTYTSNHRPISSTYNIGRAELYNTKTIYFNKKKSSGDKIALGMEDGIYHSTSTAKVSGQVDFR